MDNTTTKPFYNSTIPSDWSTPEFGAVFSFLKSFSFSREQLTNEKTADEIRNIHYGDIHATYENEILDFEVEQTVPYLMDGLVNKKNFDDEDFPSLQFQEPIQLIFMLKVFMTASDPSQIWEYQKLNLMKLNHIVLTSNYKE